MVFRRGDGSARRYRRRPADAATMAVAFGVPLTLGRWKEGPKGSDDLTPGKIARWLATLSPADFEGLGEEPSGGSPPA